MTGAAMTRVAFTMIGGGRGTGGYNYLLNLLRVLCTHEGLNITPVLLLGTDLPDIEIRPFRVIPGLEVVQSPSMNAAHKPAALRSALLLGADAAHLQLLRTQRIDLLFESAQFFGWRLGIPVIAWIPDFQHRHLPRMFTRKGYWKREIGFLAEMAARRTIMLSSEDARRDCESFYPSTVGRTRAVRFAVPPAAALATDEARAVADRYQLPACFFFMPNQLSKHKNHLLVLDALALLRAQLQQVVIVSSGKQADERHPEHFPAVQARLKALRLEPQFRMLGMIPYSDLGALMQSSVALLNPSLFEGWSTSVEEARALGVPLLLSDLPVHLEQAGADASYFDRYSAASLAAALAGFTALTPAQRVSRKALAHAEAKRRVRQFAENFATLAHDCTARYPTP
jgi:glycosyltransferase involved in cell wall biosynthesis